MATTVKRITKLISINVAVFIAILIVLEIVLRALPVSGSAHRLEVNAENPVIRFKENGDFIWSKGWDFEIVTRKSSNNYGFFDDQDYIEDHPLSLMAIIGDSFVEALQVENSLTVQGKLAAMVAERGRVYSFAAAGSALSTYLAYAKYVRDEFRANAMTFVIVGNDFHESLCKYKYKPSFHCFVERGEEEFDLIRRDYNVPSWANFFRNVALFRYVVFNLGIVQAQNLRDLISGLFRREKQVKHVGNVQKQVSAGKLDDSKAVVDEFFERVPEVSGLSSNEILFVIDGMRSVIYDGRILKDVDGSYFWRMREYFLATARKLGFEVIDMQDVFAEDYTKYKQRFEFRIDSHWNERAHHLVAQQIEKSKVFHKTFSK